MMTENILNPHDARLEEVVLGACLAESTAMALVADKLRAEMFYEDNSREIYSALLALHHTGRPIDIITVKNELAARGKLDAVGGAVPDYGAERRCGFFRPSGISCAPFTGEVRAA